jgi:integrase
LKTLSTHLEEYLEPRHTLGFKLRLAGGLLHRFVLFAREKKASFITTELALEWATQPPDCQPSQWANRLGMVRRFAQYVSGADPRTEIPALELLPHRYHRKPPYLYSDTEVERLMQASGQLPDPDDLRAISHSTLFGLLAVTGMRLGEAIGLDRPDVDLDHGILTVRQAKFNKSRLVPVHGTTQQQLQDYAQRRDQLCPQPKSPSFFLSERGTRLNNFTARRWFILASRKSGLRAPTDHFGPRIHDLRHRFAYQTLLRWYREGQDVEAHLPELATYLGHGHVADTYWYLSASPELLNLDAPFIGRFLDHLEKDRDNTPRSRNIRLAAIHSFLNT